LLIPLGVVVPNDKLGLSFYGASILEARLRLRDDEFAAAGQQFSSLELIAYRAPLYQVRALPGTAAAPRLVPNSPRPVPQWDDTVGGAPVSLASLLQQLEQRRGGL